MISGLGTQRFFRDTPTPLLWAALVLAVLVYTFLLAWLRPAVTVEKKSQAHDNAIFSSPGWQPELQEQQWLSDWEPVFLPTHWNYGYKAWHLSGTAADAELGTAPLGAFPPESRARLGAPLGLPPEAPFVLPPIEDALSLQHWGVAETLGRRARPADAAPPPRQAFMRVERVADGTLVFEEPVQLGLSAADIGAVWRPAAFSFWTDLHGLIGAPVPLPWTDNATGSGNATV
ncbi:MAG: hypothetical protein LBV28_00425, partial [Puniceicoccales bacterium]|nr:hypothetical protein [Puniceicoccales bacterium]